MSIWNFIKSLIFGNSSVQQIKHQIPSSSFKRYEKISYIKFYDKKLSNDTSVWRRGDLHIGKNIIPNVVDIIICKIEKNKKLEQLVSKENWVKQGFIDYEVYDLTNVYVVAVQKNNTYSEHYNLFFYKEGQYICKVEDVKYHHTTCKLNKMGELLCEQYHKGYNSARMIKVIENGQIVDLCKSQTLSEELEVSNLNNTIYPQTDFKFEDEKYIYIYFYKKECPSFYIANYYCEKYADEFNIIKNKFDDDISTVNYCAKFNKDDILHICFMAYCLDKRWANSAYAAGLYGSMKSKTCAGSLCR